MERISNSQSSKGIIWIIIIIIIIIIISLFAVGGEIVNIHKSLCTN